MTTTGGDQGSPDEAVVLQTVATLAAELAHGALVGAGALAEPARRRARPEYPADVDSLDD